MNKAQPIRFSNVDEFLDHLSEEELKIVTLLRRIIFDCLPEIKEKLSYNVPYYSKYSRICFIWPASVPWGKVKNNGVALGFCRGHLMQDEAGYLEKDNRKQVFTKTFYSVKDIDVNILKAYLFEAVFIDKQYKSKSI